jgi:hypothetical protein
MSTLAEIEQAILKLPASESRQLLQWLSELNNDAWDQEMEEDAKSGKLDRLWQEAQREVAQGDVMPLDEFLRHS